MKKVLFLLVFISIGLSVNAQSKIRMDKESLGFWTVTADTMQITSADRVIKAAIYNPSTSTENVKIEGRIFTVDGIETNGINLIPGEAAINLGFDYAELDSVKVYCTEEAWIILLIDND